MFDKDILCHTHEQMLHDCDDYAVDWVRRLNIDSRSVYDGKLLLVPNRRPDLLLKFVCSHIWRHSVSQQNAAHNMDLGPWEVQLRHLIFGHGSRYNPSFHITRQAWTSEGGELGDLLIPPHRIPAQGRRRWEFDLGGLLWLTRLDERDVDRNLERFKANDADPVPVLVLDNRELVDRPGIIDIAVNMFRRDYLQEQQENQGPCPLIIP
ncbi:MAG TPA: hypothetical protein VGF77_11015 [Allosphingosinicella sp.]